LEFATRGDPLDTKAWNELAQAYELSGNSVAGRSARKSADDATSDLKKMSDLYLKANARPDDVQVRLELVELCKKTNRKKLAEIWAKAAQEAGMIKVQDK
jgi:predicted Zn-dependent protease